MPILLQNCPLGGHQMATLATINLTTSHYIRTKFAGILGWKTLISRMGHRRDVRTRARLFRALARLASQTTVAVAMQQARHCDFPGQKSEARRKNIRGFVGRDFPRPIEGVFGQRRLTDRPRFFALDKRAHRGHRRNTAVARQ